MSLLKTDDTWPLLALMIAGTTLSIWLEHRFRWAAKLSAPVIALLVAMTLTNTRVMPLEAPVYDFVGRWLVPLALPLLLFRANFIDIARRTGKMLIAGSSFFLRHFPHEAESDSEEARNRAAAYWERKGIGLMDLGKSIAVASSVVAVAMLLKKPLDVSCAPHSDDSRWLAMGKVLVTNHYVLITGISLMVSTVFARFLRGINGPEEIGSFILYLFLFTVGLPADLVSVLFKSPILFGFCGVIAFTNLIFTLVVGKVCRLGLEDLLLSVNATVGGPPTAAAMAISKGWAGFVLPAILVGIWGYIIGTPLGLFVTSWLSK